MHWDIPVVRLPGLARRHRPRVVYAVFGAVSAATSIGVIAAAATAVHRPLLVPSLGPTAFLIFERPRLPAASPRNIIVGHLLGLATGEVALHMTGAVRSTAALDRLTAAQALAAAISVALVMAAMVTIGVPHPPAAATTLIVSLGLLTGARELGGLIVAVCLLAGQGLAIDRLFGLDYPTWASPRPPMTGGRGLSHAQHIREMRQ